MGLKLKIDSIPRKSIPGSSIIYIPSGKFLKYATFGYSSLAADLIYIWAIQYYGTYTITERFEYLNHIFSIIAELDPRYLDPYEVGALIAVYEAKDLDLAFKILDRGFEKNPDQWIFPFISGHYAQMFKKDYQLAKKYYKKAMGIPGSPAIAQRLYAAASFKSMDYQTALKQWVKILETTEDKRIKKIASNHIYQVKAAIDIQAIKQAIQAYKEKYGRNPSSLQQLVSKGFLSAIPKDLDQNDYVYDPETGEVKAPIIPWKR
jgi:tetratricopeptide (TPR) repeat protein